MKLRTSLLLSSVSIILALAACSHPASSGVSAWVPQVQSNEMPMYGGIEKTPAQKAADAKMVQDAVAMASTPQKASDAMVQLGFQYLLQKHDADTAMKRFNQAYLLDPDNGADYQGMAVTTLVRSPNAISVAEPLFKRGVDSKRVNPDVFADYGRFLLMQHRPADAVSVLERGVALDSDYVETGSLLAEAYYAAGQRAKGCTLAKRWQTKAQPEIAKNLGMILAEPDCKAI